MKLLFDIGATHLRVARAGVAGPEHILRTDTPSEPGIGIEAFLELAREQGNVYESAIGGYAGVITPEGLIEMATNLPAWNEFPFAAALSDRLGCGVTLHNDAELAGLGEALYGAGKGYGTVAYIGIGTGVGTSLIRNGHIVMHTSGGEERLGIITLANGKTLEEVAGGHSLKTQYGAAPETLPQSLWEELTPSLVEVVGNAIARWSPDVIVLAGSLMHPGDGFDAAEVRAQVHASIPIEPSLLGDACGLWGAYALSSEI
jgi:predicted NBD/HSP70 family sugar kinase